MMYGQKNIKLRRNVSLHVCWCY